MRRLGAVMAAAVALASCATIPGSETIVVAWDEVAIVEREMNDLSLSLTRWEWWARNGGDQVACIVLLQRGSLVAAKTWTLAPRSYVPMFNDDINAVSEDRFFRGRYISWSPLSGQCNTLPTISPDAITDRTNW